MNLTDVFIKKPIFATVLSLIILLIGVRAYFSLPVRQYPQIDTTTIEVSVSYPGASSEIIEGYITTPIENSLSGINGIDYIISTSDNGQSTITIYFVLGYDIDAALADISDKVSSVRWKLPKDIYDPIIEKSDPNARPTMYLSFSNPNMTGEEINDYLTRLVQPQLQVLPGVGQADIWSSNKYGMRIWLNPYAMAAHDITASDIIDAINTSNLQAPSGSVKTSWQKFNINVISDINKQEQFNSLILRNTNGQLTRINDVGRAVLGSATTDVSVFIDGKHGIVMPITPQSNANPLDVSKYVNEALAKLKQNLPKGMTFTTLIDTSTFIAASINEVQKTIIEAAVLVIVIIFLFLGSFRILLIPTVTIPLSIIGVFGMMSAMGYTINTLTLLALVLAIGMVVDDAIVVAENIYRHILEGKTPMEAALVGAKEIQFAVVSITLTLAAVYAPIGFMSGLTGALFKEFAFTLAGAVIISGFIAITLSPMMCSRIIKADSLSGPFARFAHHINEIIRLAYTKSLTKVMQMKKTVLSLVLVVIACCYLFYIFSPSELAPKEDMGWIFSQISAPASANLNYTEKYTDELIPIYKKIPEIDHYGIINGADGVNSAISFIGLTDWSKRTKNVDQLIQELFPKFWSIPGVLAFPANPFSLPGSSSYFPIEIALQTLGSYEHLSDVTQKILAKIKQNHKITNVDYDLKIDQPQLDIKIDRDKAGDLGISIKEISDAINLGFGEPTTTQFTIEGHNYDVIPALEEEYRNKPDLINSLQLRVSSGDLVPLSNLISIKETTKARTLNHFQQLRSSTITADLKPGYTTGEAVKYIQKIIDTTATKDIKVDYSGQTRQFIQSSGEMLSTILFAVIFIFLVLAAQFESFRDPLIVMFSFPLSTFGAFLVMRLTGSTLNIYSEIGLLTLIGLISKHGILIVEFANQLRETGKNFHEAIIESASIRLKPILMTTAAIIIGAFPLAFAHGAGAVSRQQIGWVIIGGMTIGTLFTLFVIPTMYSLFCHKSKP